MFDTSLVPVLVSTVAVMMLGVVWYSSRFFGKLWAQEVKMDEGGDTEAMIKAVAFGVVQNFIIVYILSNLLGLLEGFPERSPFVIALWIAILVATTHMGSVIWERRTTTYFLITAGYLVSSIMLSALILTKWPWA